MDETDTAEPVNWRDYETDLRELCKVKADEFHLLGYDNVTDVEIWDCALHRLKGKRRLYEVAEQILAMQIGQFMNFTTVNAFKGVFASDTFDALNNR